MKGCDLCNGVATMYCESDEAFLCWECDGRVHSANFLVARHCRTLLCRSCRSPTPWRASGSHLAPIASVCDHCFGKEEGEGEDYRIERKEDDDDDDDDDDEDEDEDDDDEDEDDDEIQVVPWSSSCEEEQESRRICDGFLKRMRETGDPHSRDLPSSSSASDPPRSAAEDDATSASDSFRTSMDRKASGSAAVRRISNHVDEDLAVVDPAASISHGPPF